MGLIKFIKGIFKDDGSGVYVGPEWEFLEAGEKRGPDPVPRWVVKAIDKYLSSRPRQPYNEFKHFVGRTFIYKVYFKTVAQGYVEEYVWRKLKKKSSHKKKPNITKHRRKPRTSNKSIVMEDYCKSCHRRTVFKENKAGHFHCSKCGWRNSDDW